MMDLNVDENSDFGFKSQIAVRESLRLWQDQFLRAMQEKKLQLQSLHAIAIGRDMKRLEMQLRKYVRKKKSEDRVHFVKETPTLAPYPAFIDVPSKVSSAKLIMEHSMFSHVKYYFWFLDFIHQCDSLHTRHGENILEREP